MDYNTTNKTTEKLTEKAFSRLMLTSVLGILVCLVCLCSATWAWFSTDVSTEGNSLGSGQFDLVVSVADSSADTVTVSQKANGEKVCTLGDAGEYAITLKISDDTTVTKGFCTVTVNGKTYCTASINAETDPFTFTIDAKEAGMTITFSAAWGLPAEDDLVEKGTVLTVGTASATEE